MARGDSPEWTHTHRSYVPGCPACELNKLYIEVILQDNLSQAAHEGASKAYRERKPEELHKFLTT